VDAGGVMNRDCNDVDYPADGMCINGWKYTDGAGWKDEPTIRLTCKDKSNSNHPTFLDQVPMEFEDKDTKNLVAARSTLGQVPKEQACKEFILSSTGGTRSYQESRFGTYTLQNSLVNGRVTYFNEEKNQHLFWISKYDKYWMVSGLLIFIHGHILLRV
jgi:hypothetical protein